MHRCSTCGLEKSLSDFRYRKDRDQPHSTCRPCERDKNLARYHDNPSTNQATRRAARKYALNKLYGLSIEQYEEMARQRDYRCDICGETEQQNRALAVDHCHTTGKVRGLLCQACNTAIGKLRDDPVLIRKAAEYVQSHQ